MPGKKIQNILTHSKEKETDSALPEPENVGPRSDKGTMGSFQSL